MPRAIAFITLLIAAFLIAGPAAHAQNSHRNVLVRAHIINGDTVPDVRLGEVQILARAKFKNERQRRKWTRYVYNVKKALPYARLIARELTFINDTLAMLQTPEEQQAFIDRKEVYLFKKYETRLKHLTIKQGRILIKLVDRETGHTSYELIHTLKGGFKAFWWQGIACLFGSNLKTHYDPLGEDKNLENVVLLIDQGYY